VIRQHVAEALPQLSANASFKRKGPSDFNKADHDDATEPRNSAIPQAIPLPVLISMRWASCPDVARQDLFDESGAFSGEKAEQAPGPSATGSNAFK